MAGLPDNWSEQAVEATEETNTLKETGGRHTFWAEAWRETRPDASAPHLGYDVVHVTSGVVGAVVVAEAVEDGLGFELVFVCD